MTTAAIGLRSVQTVRKAVLVATVLILLAMFALTRATLLGPAGHIMVVGIGICLIGACIVGRAWCSLYIGGRKVRELVTIGPYSLCRNPLYSLSIVGAVGAGAQGGSAAVALAAGLVTFVIFRVVVAREERTLLSVHGEAYADYLRSTPRFFPSIAGWRDAEVMEVRPGRVTTTLLDGLFLLAFIPLGAGLSRLADAGLTPVVFNLP